jgi:hypothetical protein
MPSPTPEFIEELIQKFGSEEKAFEYLGRWSMAIQDCTPENPRDRFTCPMPLGEFPEP